MRWAGRHNRRKPMWRLRNPSTSWRSNAPVLLVLFLLFFIQIEPTIIGRAWTHLLGLNIGGVDALTGGQNALTTALQSLCLVTMAVPFLIWVTSRSVFPKASSS